MVVNFYLKEEQSYDQSIEDAAKDIEQVLKQTEPSNLAELKSYFDQLKEALGELESALGKLLDRSSEDFKNAVRKFKLDSFDYIDCILKKKKAASSSDSVSLFSDFNELVYF